MLFSSPVFLFLSFSSRLFFVSFLVRLFVLKEKKSFAKMFPVNTLNWSNVLDAVAVFPHTMHSP